MQTDHRRARRQEHLRPGSAHRAQSRGAAGIRSPGDHRQYRALAQVFSDEAGRFAFENIAAGTNTFLFKPASPLRERTAIAQVPERGTADMGDVQLGSGGTVSGRVIRAEDQSPLAGQEICIGRVTFESPWQKTASDAEGRFLFRSLPEGSMTVWAPAIQLEKRVELKPNDAREVMLVAGGQYVRGRLLYGKQPLQTELFVVNWANGEIATTVKTDSEGRFELTLPTGNYRWEAQPPDQDVRQQASGLVSMRPPSDVEQTLVIPSGFVAGSVLDPQGKPAANAEVWLSMGGPHGFRHAAADADGRFAMKSVPDGTYDVHARRRGGGGQHVHGSADARVAHGRRARGALHAGGITP